jgi:hypothetical protein
VRKKLEEYGVNYLELCVILKIKKYPKCPKSCKDMSGLLLEI